MNGWIDCGYYNFPKESPPDIHPGNFWKCETLPSDGHTCVGLVDRNNNKNEAIAHQLPSPIKEDTCYHFTIDLCRSNSYLSRSRITNLDINDIAPAVFRIWGSNLSFTKRE